MKKRTLLPQITTPVERSTAANSKTEGGIQPSWARNPGFLGGALEPIQAFATPFAGDDAQ